MYIPTYSPGDSVGNRDATRFCSWRVCCLDDCLLAEYNCFIS